MCNILLVSCKILYFPHATVDGIAMAVSTRQPLQRCVLRRCVLVALVAVALRLPVVRSTVPAWRVEELEAFSNGRSEVRRPPSHTTPLPFTFSPSRLHLLSISLSLSY
jgi:hypothetical protein